MNETNNRIRENIRSLTNVYYIDVFKLMVTSDKKPRIELFGPDLLHMNAQGYAIWKRLVKDVLKSNGGMPAADQNHYSGPWMGVVIFVSHLILLF